MSFTPLSPTLLQVPPKALLILIAIVSSQPSSTATLQVSGQNGSVVSGLPLRGSRFVEGWQQTDHQLPFFHWRIGLVETSAVRCESQPLRTICVFPNTRQ